MDGRDTPPTSGVDYIAKLEQKMREYWHGQDGQQSAAATMPWTATSAGSASARPSTPWLSAKAEGGATATDAVAAHHASSYNNGVTDEFVIPFVVVDAHGKPRGADSRRGVVHQLQLPRRPRPPDHPRAGPRERPQQEGGRDLDGWEALDETIPRSEIPKNLHYLCMTQYDKLYELPLVMPAGVDGQHPGAICWPMHHLRNLRVAETEKFAHVTYFFNGGIETPFPGEERMLIPSLKVATYDLRRR